MTFYQSRAISKVGLHVRRAAWSADKWFMIWRGTWFCFAGGNPPQPVQATDYGADDLQATDWTTMPAVLAACPIDPAIGSTGGGDPVPGTDGFPDDLTPTVGGVTGSSIPPGPDDPPVLPPPDPGTGVTVTFAGLMFSTGFASISTGLEALNGQAFTLTGSGNTWTKGVLPDDPSPLGQSLIPGLPDPNYYWLITATRTGSKWEVTLQLPPSLTAFATLTPAGRKGAGTPIDNTVTGTSSQVHGGTATVGTG